MQALHEVLGDAWQTGGVGFGFTFPGPHRGRFSGRLGPWLRIDYILYDGAFDTVAVRRLADSAGAGHYPVWAKLAFAGMARPERRARRRRQRRRRAGREMTGPLFALRHQRRIGARFRDCQGDRGLWYINNRDGPDRHPAA